MDHKNHDFKEFREQFNLLKGKLSQQEIVTESDIKSATKKSIGWIKRSGMLYLIVCVASIPFCSIALMHMGFSVPFTCATAVYTFAAALITFITHRAVCGSDRWIENSLLEVSEAYAKLRRRYMQTMAISIPALSGWCIWLYFDTVIKFPDNPEMASKVLEAIIIGLVVGAPIGIWRYIKTIRHADGILAHVKELQEHDAQANE
jgi:hypothetical protein